MLMLHRSLAGLGRLAAKEASRSSITCVYVEDAGREKSRVTATDGKRLVRVTTKKDDKLTAPKARGFDASANGSKEALVPAWIFTKVLAEIPINKQQSEREFAGVTLEKDQVTFAANTRDDRMKRVTPVEPLVGDTVKFPPLDGVFPKEEPVFTMHVSPTLLGELLLTVASVVGKGPGVTLEFYAKGSENRSPNPKGPMTIKAKNWKGDVEVEAIIMPLDVRDYMGR